MHQAGQGRAEEFDDCPALNNANPGTGGFQRTTALVFLIFHSGFVLLWTKFGQYLVGKLTKELIIINNHRNIYPLEYVFFYKIGLKIPKKLTLCSTTTANFALYTNRAGDQSSNSDDDYNQRHNNETAPDAAADRGP